MDELARDILVAAMLQLGTWHGPPAVQVAESRGWPATGSKPHALAAWQQLEAQASTQEAGSWASDFELRDMQPEKLTLLARTLDTLFLGGGLQAWLEAHSLAPVRFQPIASAPGPDDWIAHFVPELNAVALRVQRWAHEQMMVGPSWPADYEGILCISRLQVKGKGEAGREEWEEGREGEGERRRRRGAEAAMRVEERGARVKGERGGNARREGGAGRRRGQGGGETEDEEGVGKGQAGGERRK